MGFAWGYDAFDVNIELRHVAALATGDWDTHLPVLRASYPRWEFAEQPSL